LILVATVALAPSDLVDTYGTLWGIAFAPFLWHLIAQRGVRVGFKYWPTFILAWLFLPVTAFVVWIVRRPIKSD